MANPPALTTTFTPPSSCLASFFHSRVDSLGPSPSATECFPSGKAFTSFFYFSPGLICPSGYTTAVVSQVAIPPVTDTRVACCPSNYPWVSDIDGASGCISSFTPPAGNSLTVTLGLFDPTASGVSLRPTGSVTRTIATQDAGFVQAEAINMRYQISDLIEQGTTSSSVFSAPPLTSAAPSSVLPTTTSVELTTTPPTQYKSQGGLSAGAKVGIGVAVPLFVVLSALLVAVILLLRRKATTGATGATSYSARARDEAVISSMQEVGIQPTHRGLHGTAMHGAGGNETLHELH